MDYSIVLKRIEPKASPIVAKVIIAIKATLKKQGITAKVVPGGSYAKNTHIGETFDCDIFIQFSKEADLQKIVKIGDTVAKSFKTTSEIIHGSRDYIGFTVGAVTFELIPALKLKKPEDAQNIMDLSPYHVTWFTKQLAKKKKTFVSEIRLFKQFLKAAHVYGAESYVQGFSGHVVDILVFYYGGFLPTIKAIAKWPPSSAKNFKKVIIDSENVYKKKDVAFFMNESKIHAPIIVIDPIISDRNAAAAVSEKCYDYAIERAKKFIKKPSASFFEIINPTAELLFKNYKKPVLTFIATSYPGKKDIVGTKLVKTLEWIARLLSEHGFSVVATDWSWTDDAKLFVVLESAVIPRVYRQDGPLLSMPEAVAAFSAVHKTVKKDSERVYIEKSRSYTDARKFAQEVICKDPRIVERVASLSLKQS